MDLNKRFLLCGEYLCLEANMLLNKWKGFYSKYKNGTATIPETYILLHPKLIKKSLLLKHSEEVADQIIEEIRGKRTFHNIKNISKESCQSNELWGYSCCYQNSSNHKDHLFPFSKGGISHKENLYVLCEDHNRMKSSDLHIYPWENGIPNWVKKQIDIINKVIC
jgi:hypothetical protein